MPAEDVDPTFEALLDYVRDNRGFDFTGYKRASLTRRVRKRMHEVGISSFDEYHDFLEVHPEEFTHLFNTILINVTSFFRDESAWDFARGAGASRDRRAERRAPAHPRVVGRLRVRRRGVLHRNAPGGGARPRAARRPGQDLRDRRRRGGSRGGQSGRLQRKGGRSDSSGASREVPRAVDQSFAFNKDLRRAVIFGRHDLVKDAPISRVDLIVCRNTLMYFNSDVQSHIYARLPLRAEARRLPLPGEVRDAPDPDEHVRADRPQAPPVLARAATR